ncbi:hypothetical protein Tsubulata_044099 [Turnera subulata]|uniref:Reverse transcriptase zinc-binding domain-containing protein n=1 Tax=Turnera subulata TaxID=218843 RepID=A0A9Q0JJW9_9ROSI|nr:hypothetical protein Tsubulata_044099 [Turnera subulata]
MFKLPAAVRKRLVRIQREFLWGGTVQRKRINLVAWDKVLTPKIHGGLGVEDLSLKNRCLLYKWFWRYSMEEEHLWRQLIYAKYGLHTQAMSPSFNLAKASPLWRHVVRSGEGIGPGTGSLQSGMTLQLGRGDRASFWIDPWSTLGCLRVCFPRLFRVSSFPHATIAEVKLAGYLLLSVPTGWVRSLYRWEEEICGQLLELLEVVVLDPARPDTWSWVHDGHGQFSVRGVLPDVESLCPFCESLAEDVAHLFLLCPRIVQIWQRMCRWWGVCWVSPGSMESWIPYWLGLAGFCVMEQAWMTLGSSMLWSIWALGWFKILHPCFPYSTGATLSSSEPFKSWSSGNSVTIAYSK